MKRFLHEPTTFLTNLPMIAVGVLWGAEIWEVYSITLHSFHSNLGLSFYTVAGGSVAGAIFHGFRHHFAEANHQRIWKVALMGIGLTLFFNLMAAVAAVSSPVNYQLWRWVLAAGLALFALQTVKFHGFGHSVKFLSIGFVVTVVAFGLFAWRQPAAGPVYMFLGSLVTVVAGGLWATGWSLHEKFNHNDLFHMIQLAGLWLLYQGALLTTTAQLP
ncbi:MAG: hypothetical protein VX822_00920 [Candidatus Neomarinimicrobiota bacterium]|nr:hypothetical protein [Candidatus Neomarinimicrobiota bacterium]